MRFVRGPIPENPEFQPEAGGWNAIREPDPVWMQVLAVPVMLATMAVLYVVITFGTVVAWGDLPVRLVVAFVLMIPVHELIHALASPAFGMSGRSLIGFWPSRLLFYAHYEGELTRERFLGVLIAPTAVLTVVPLLLCVIFPWDAPSAVALAFANGVGAAGDLLGIGLIVTQIPRRAIVRNKGWRTYWKGSSPGIPRSSE